MKMNLKNYSNLKHKKFKFKVSFTSKNLYIFLISLSAFAFILGILFFFFLNNEDKNTMVYNTSNYFTIKDSYNYLSILKDNILSNSYNIFLFWILGLSIIGLLIVIFLYFCEIFSIGFTISSIVYTYKWKGLLKIIAYIFPSKILFVIVMFLLTFFSIKISYKLIRLCFFKDEINIKKEVSKYFKILVFSFISIIVISILSTFIDPIIISLFNKI